MRSPRGRFLALATLVGVAFPAPLAAQDAPFTLGEPGQVAPVRREVAIAPQGAPFEIATNQNASESLAAAPAGNGRTLLLWQQYGTAFGDGRPSLAGALLGSRGAPKAATFTLGDGDQSRFAASVAHGSQGFLACWWAVSAGTYVQRLNAAGHPLGEPRQLGSDGSGKPSIAYGDGRFVALWGAANANTTVAVLSPEGQTLAVHQLASHATGTPLYNPIAHEFLLTDPDAGELQRLSAAGEPLGAPVSLGATAKSPQVAYDAASGTYLAAWTDAHHAGSALFTRRFDRSLHPLGAPIAVTYGSDPRAAESLAIALDGTAILTWTLAPADSPAHLTAQALTPAGALKGAPVPLADDDAHDVACTYDPSTRAFTLAWLHLDGVGGVRLVEQ